MRLVISIVVVAMVAAAIFTAAFGNAEAPTPGGIVDFFGGGDENAAATGTATPADGRDPTAPFAETPTLSATTVPPRISGLTYPVAGSCLPGSDDLMPNAPREYRQGVHEGVDFYGWNSCAVIGLGTEVLTVEDGTVIRADWAYEELTGDTLAQLNERVGRGEGDDAAVKDVFRGRQVWIDHGGGVVTRYAHLSGIADGVSIGAEVEQGAIIGYVGESGTPESLTAPGTEVHLHFEIRVGGSYLGRGLGPAEVRDLYGQAFSP